MISDKKEPQATEEGATSEIVAQPPAEQFEVLINFTDPEDGSHVYWAGDPYPRDGYRPAAERVAYLQGEDNKFNAPVISGEAKKETK